MAKLKMKYYRYFAIMLIIALMFSTFGVVQGVFADKKQTTVQSIDQLSSQDKEIVNEISNMTGVKSEEIIKLKTTGKTWNDVLDKLKSGSEKDNKDAVQDRSNLLAEAGLDADYIKKLRDEGFTDSQIIQAKALVDRVSSQLKQILEAKSELPAQLSNPLDQENTDMQDIEAYNELAGKIDLKTAVYLQLKLEKDFGSMEKVLDEYLLSLQIGVDLNQYLSDKETHDKAKSEQLAKFDQNKIITLASIEAKVLELLKNENTSSNQNTVQTEPNKQTDPNNLAKDNQDEMLTSPLPDVQSTKPANPQADLMKEVNDLRNKSLNY